MSVFTAVSHSELEQFLRRYDVGDLVEHHGISTGVENTNYFVTTSQNNYVLTLFEHLNNQELPFYLDFMAFMSEHDVPSAHPIADTQGHYLRQVCGKPAALIQKLPGASILDPSAQNCYTLGQLLGKLHCVSKDFPQQRDNVCGPHWWRTTIQSLDPHLSAGELKLVHSEIEYQASFRNTHLPTGVIHADLFRDNVLFLGADITGMIDFYQACTDVLIYDLAISVNDWCSLDDGQLDNTKAQQMIAGYHAKRPLGDAEKQAWPVMLRAGALRFWLSRLRDLHFPREGEVTHTKNPAEYQNILTQRIEQHNHLNAHWPGDLIS